MTRNLAICAALVAVLAFVGLRDHGVFRPHASQANRSRLSGLAIDNGHGGYHAYPPSGTSGRGAMHPSQPSTRFDVEKGADGALTLKPVPAPDQHARRQPRSPAGE